MVDREPLKVTIGRTGAAMLVALDGDLDVYVANDARTYLEEAIDRAVAHSVGRVVIDASRVSFCDSTGLSVVVRAREEATRRGVVLSVRDLPDPIRELLRLTGLEDLVDTQVDRRVDGRTT